MSYPITCPHCLGQKILTRPCAPEHVDKPCWMCQGTGQLDQVPEDIVKQVKLLQQELDGLRDRYHISAKGEPITHYELDAVPGSDDRIEAIADGFGGATLQRVEGDYDNMFVHGSRHFDTEEEACQAAEWIDEHHGDMEGIFNGENPHHEEDKTEPEEVS